MATPVVAVLQVPPDVASLKVVEPPSHISIVPVIADGNGLTEMVTLPDILLVQPVTEEIATAVYEPAVVCRPKSSEAPAPMTGVPTGEASTYN